MDFISPAEARADAQRRPHGGEWAYRGGCRCDACRAAHATTLARNQASRVARRSAPKAGVDHGPGGYSEGCRCERCRLAERERRRANRRTRDRERSAQRRAAGVENLKTHGTAGYKLGCRCEQCSSPGIDALRREYRERQDVSVAGAARRGFQWTGPELEIAARRDLSTIEVARALGRTYAAVRSARWKIDNDPRFSRLAGVSLNAEDGMPQ